MDKTLILYGTGQVIAAATSASVELQQEAEEYDLLPDLSDETTAQWKCFKPGNKSWIVAHQGFYVAEMGNGWAKKICQNEDVQFNARVYLGSINIEGQVHLNNVNIDAPGKNLAKFSATLIGDNFPNIT